MESAYAYFKEKQMLRRFIFENPLDPAPHWKEQGAEFLRVVDLDGAFTGGSQNLDASGADYSFERPPSTAGRRYER